MASIYPWLVPKILPFYDRIAARRFWQEFNNLCLLQWCTPEELHDHALAKLKALLAHSTAHVPYYRDLFRSVGIDPGKLSALSDLHRVPATGKADLRPNYPDRVLADNLPDKRRQRWVTSGSTGCPFEFFRDTAATDLSRASYLFFREWAGAPLWLPRIQIASPPHFYGAVPGVLDLALRRVLLGESVVRLSGATLQLPDFLSHVRRLARRGYFLFAYPGYAAVLAAQIQDSGVGLPQQPRVVLSYAETLTPIHRTQIEQVFGCPVADHYSSLEVLHIAQTCPDYAALMHINTERAIVRVERADGKDALPGERGRVLVTDLANEVMPLINYDLGDWGVAGPRCPCGRGFPTLVSVEGRQVEFIRTLSGHLISPATLITMVRYIVGSSSCIREFQAVQTAPDSVNLVLVPSASFSTTMEARLLGELKELLGPGMSATVSAVGRIEPEPSGKRPIIKSGVQS